MSAFSDTTNAWARANNPYSATPNNPAYSLASNTAQSNLAAMPYSQSVADMVNAANQSAQQSANAGRLGPGGQAVQNQLLANAGSQAAGQISPGTVSTIEQAMAERGGGGGFAPDSPNTNAALMRMLGQTSEQQQAAGLAGYSTLLGDNPSAPIYSAGSNLVTPGQYANTAEANQPAPTSAPRISGGGGGGSPAPTSTSSTGGYGAGYPGAGGGYTQAGLSQSELEALGMGGLFGSDQNTPDNTAVDPFTGQASNNYGLDQYWG